MLHAFLNTRLASQCGLGLCERFVDERAPRDVVAAAILRECDQGRGVERDDGARLGTGAMIVISEDTGIVRKVMEYIERIKVAGG